MVEIGGFIFALLLCCILNGCTFVHQFTIKTFSAMGYEIIIGERIKHSKSIDRIWLLEAPCDGSPTDGTNQRWPSYTGWHEFAEQTCLLDMFFDKKVGIMRSHPGIFKITKDHQAQVNQAIENYGSGYQLARLKWLKFWIDWAIENCENPSIKNS